MNEKNFSDEFLNAFVDDQLSPEDKARAYPLIHQNEDLNRRVCELRKMRDLVQLAYKEPPRATAPMHPPVRGRLGRNVAAGMLLLLGVALGWGLHATRLGHRVQQPVAHAPTTTAPNVAQIPTDAKQVKIVLHLNRGQIESMREVLDEAENVIKFYRTAGQPALVQVITNGEGLSLLRADKSPFADRIRQMQQNYSNLVFAACQNTIDRLKREQGIQAQLVPEAIVIDSGVAQIILLQQQGWAYIQV